jgi:hypothetical protein
VDLAQVARDPQKWEKVIRKLRAGMMPPPGESRPDFAAEQALRASLEDAIDGSVERVAGTRSPQRLSRVEYARAVHDLLDLDVDGNALLPPDTIPASPADVADGESYSPAVMEGYLRAADRVAALALCAPSTARRRARAAGFPCCMASRPMASTRSLCVCMPLRTAR